MRVVTRRRIVIDLQNSTPTDVAFILDELDVTGFDEITSISRAGDGNMNVTLRVCGQSSSIILKQAFPYCAKYPDIPAPVERLAVEASYYRACATSPHLSSFHAQLIGEIPRLHLLALEDLGTGADYEEKFYDGHALSVQDLGHLVDYLSHLHSHPVDRIQFSNLSNQSMRILNADYLFEGPFEKPVTETLPFSINREILRTAQEHTAPHKIIRTLQRLRKTYLSEDGASLVHGDFYPRSWIRTVSGPKIIDMEFCHFGAPEFDLGVLQGHLALADSSVIGQIKSRYRTAAPINWDLVELFQAQEVMRRVLGLAKVPFSATAPTTVRILQNALDTLAQD